MFKVVTTCLALTVFFLGQLAAQMGEEFVGRKLEIRPINIEQHFSNFNIYSLDLVRLRQNIEEADGVFNLILDLDGERFDLSIIEHDIRHPNYKLQIMTDTGLQVMDRPSNTTFRGWNNASNEGEVRLTITDDYLAGVITSAEGEEIFIQPVRDFMDYSTSEIIVYHEADVLTQLPISCGARMADHAPFGVLDKGQENTGRSLACMEAEVAIAADYSMYQKFGNSTNSVANHLLTIKNMMEANYAVFEVQFLVVTNYIVATANGDPWSASTNINTVLDDFSCWGGNGSSSFLGCTGSNGFNVSHDIGELWSDRDFNGTTVGLAWINSVCSNFFKYSVNEHFSNNNQALRALIAHEAGHNFGANHDGGGGWIMSTPLSASYVDFSSASQNAINNAMTGFGCFTTCGTTLPVQLADFSANLMKDQVQLQWETESEYGFDHFEVEHSLDGFNFEVLVEQQSLGAESSAASYQYAHLHPENGDNYYRLKLVDQDGTLTYSVVKVVSYLKNKVSIYPNPASHEVTVILSEKIERAYDILTVDGILVKSGKISASGIQVISITDLKQGIYLLRTKGAGHQKITRVSVL